MVYFIKIVCTQCVPFGLTEMSQLGEKYLDKQIENAINGVKEMKSIMDKSSDEHKTFLNSLEETKLKKEASQPTY